MKRKSSLVLLCLILSLVPPKQALLAQTVADPYSLAKINNIFGSPVIVTGIYPEGYLSLEASISSYTGSMQGISEGEIMFVQKKGRLPDWLPAAKGEITAFSSDTGFIHVFKGYSFDPKAAKLVDSNFDLSIFDRGRKAWVNPAFFLKDLFDTQAPRINALTLEKEGVEYEFKDARKSSGTFPQGRYALLASITDTSTKTSSSGVLRIKAVLDGMTVLDSRLDMASAGNGGLAFLGQPAPSRNALGNNAKLKAGELQLIRGEHSLEVFAYDFAGNETVLSWKLSIE
jgi:hypothetical protein